MKPRFALAVAALLVRSALAAEAPPSFRDARLEDGSGLTPGRALERIGRGATPEWMGFSVAAIPKVGDVCCFTSGFEVRGCSLADRDGSWGTNVQDAPSVATDMYVLVEAKGGRPTGMRLVSPSCSVDGAGRRLLWLGRVDPEASLGFLGSLLERGDGDDDLGNKALMAIAYHADGRADDLIAKRALDRSLDEDSRQQAIFWAGVARGEAGFQLLERVLASEADGDLRQHAVFALSQSWAAGAVERIKRAAVEDRDPQVRAHALFCLSQTKAPDAGEWIAGRLDAESSDHVREQAVFALSQLPDATDWLLRVLRSRREPETVRQALFWLGQSKDPRALEEIEKILDR